MKEKTCLNCSFVIRLRKCLEVVGETRKCSKNDLFIHDPWMHFCDMYKEEKKESKLIIEKLEIDGDGIRVTLTDIEKKRCRYEFNLNKKYAETLIIGNTMNLPF